MASARALRDAEYEEEEPWPVIMRSKKARSASSSNQAASALVLSTIGLLLVAAASGPNAGAPAPAATAPAGPRAHAPLQQIAGGLGNVFRSAFAVTLRDDFHSGFDGWTNGLSASIANGKRAADGWSAGPGFVQPGRLRLWSPSAKMADYEMEFSAEIDKKSLNWAFRALDTHNFYATKLTINRAASGPNTGLVHYAMLGGREFDRVQLPLPLTLQREAPCRVRVIVLGNHFVTSVNGQVISSWTDNRLLRGGIGFFGEEGEIAKLHWISVSQRDTVLGRLMASFSLILAPAPLE